MTSNTEQFNNNHFALQELNISQNHFHLPDRTSWVLFSLAPGNRTTVNVEPWKADPIFPGIFKYMAKIFCSLVCLPWIGFGLIGTWFLTTSQTLIMTWICTLIRKSHIEVSRHASIQVQGFNWWVLYICPVFTPSICLVITI